MSRSRCHGRRRFCTGKNILAKSTKSTVETSSNLLSQRLDYEALLARLGGRDRVNVERLVAAAETEATLDHANLWKRVTCTLATLAPHAIQTVGQQAVQFFAADGKYRIQVFAMEDLRDGKLSIYSNDVLDRALADGILEKPDPDEAGEHAYRIVGELRQTLLVERLDSGNTPNPSPFYKHMLGWNRKAMRITLLITATSAQIETAEKLWAMSVERYHAK